MKNVTKCKLVFTYSKKREERDNKLIDKDEETARKAVESNKEIPSQRKQWINYVNKQKGKKIIAESINEKALNEKIKAHLLPDQINIEKNTVNKKYTMEERKKKMEKRYKTSLRLSQRK